jgi:peptide/nickel transport system substrate-binding protein
MNELSYWTRRSISRRSVLRGTALGAAGLAGAALVGCGGGDVAGPAPVQPTQPGTPAATPTAGVTAPEPKRGGTLRQTTVSVNPHFSPYHPGTDPSFHNTWRRSTGYYDSLWNMLVTDDPDRIVLLRAAEMYEQVDASTAVVRLRPGLRYHDQPRSQSNSKVNARVADAEDVVANHEYRKVPPAAYVRELRHEMDMTAIDDRTIQLDFAQPYAFLHEASYYLIPREMYDEQVLKEHIPIGTGPYRYKAHQVGSWEEIERNPDYFLEGRPFLDGKRLTFVPDAAAGEAAFRARQTDNYGFENVLQRDSVARDLGDDIFTISEPAASGMNILLNIRVEPFKDIRIREAIHRAINWQRIIDTIYLGNGERTWWGNPANLHYFPIGFDAVREYADYDPQRAAQLVAAAKADGGYSGRELELMTPAEAQTWVDGGRLVGEDLRRAGFDIKLTVEALNVYLQRSGPKDLKDMTKPADFDITMANVIQPYRYMHTDSGSWWNNLGLEDPDVDAIVNKIHQTMDHEARRALSQEFELMLARKYTNTVPGIFTFSHVAWYKHVKGLDFERSRSGTAGWQTEMWFDA